MEIVQKAGSDRDNPAVDEHSIGQRPKRGRNDLSLIHIFGVPRIVSLCFWGGVWGAVFGAVWTGPRASNWWAGIILGLAAALTGLFIVAAIKGLPIGGGWVLGNWIKSLLINGTWGLGVGLLLMAMPYQTASRADHAYR